MRVAVSLVLAFSAVVFCRPVHAARYALIAANNRGWASEVPLQFAHDDGTRLATVLKEIGGFKGHNLLILRDATPQSIEAGLKRLSARMHANPDPGGQDLLFFYYSGHADEKALHPGDLTPQN
ncbi:MAG: caspase family protein [Deltaproteobacteria bacterium]|nr:caspase family protein [Deltaproteobacteria bacterium]